VVAELLEKAASPCRSTPCCRSPKRPRAHAMLENGDDLVGRIVLHPWEM